MNLKRYVGHRAHLEFTAPESGPMGVRRIVEVPQPPPIATRAPAPLVAALEGRKFASAADLASACQEAFDTAVEQFAAKPASDAGDTSADDPAEGDAGRAALADWIATHPKLFQVPDGEPATQLARLTGEFLAAQESLRGRLRHESRTAPAMLEGSGENELLLIRGSYKTPGERVPRRLLEALGGDAASTPARGSGRLELARQIVDPTNPLTARVLVNRVWHHLTGRGIVPSVDNFGVLGERPTHPELLDHLAARFVEQGWSLKQLIREIVQTQTYRMESRPRADNVARDPTNKLLHAMRMRRLQGEAIRDTLLTLSGRLDPKQFGPSVPVYLTEFMQGRGRPKGGPLDGGGRRSIYISVRRNFLSPMMLAFDTPIPLATMGRRNVSNVPAQALILMNDPLVVEQTAGWARRALEVDDVDAAGRIDLLYRQAFARLPGADEREAALDFLARQGTEYGLPPEKALADPRPWADLCHVLVNVKEFIFVR